jgi:hypothetical protein
VAADKADALKALVTTYQEILKTNWKPKRRTWLCCWMPLLKTKPR